MVLGKWEQLGASKPLNLQGPQWEEERGLLSSLRESVISNLYKKNKVVVSGVPETGNQNQETKVICSLYIAQIQVLLNLVSVCSFRSMCSGVTGEVT